MAQLPQAAPEPRSGPAARVLAVRKDAATSLLLEDHLKIKKLFKQFGQARSAGSTALKKATGAAGVCRVAHPHPD